MLGIADALEIHIVTGSKNLIPFRRTGGEEMAAIMRVEEPEDWGGIRVATERIDCIVANPALTMAATSARVPAWGRGLSLLVVLLLAGCAMMAEQQKINHSEQALDQYKECISSLGQTQRYLPLAAHIGLGVYATPTQLSDERLPSPENARLYAAFQDEMTPCRARLLTALTADGVTQLVPVYSEAFTAVNKLAGLIIERKITWGEAARRERDLSVLGVDHLTSASRQLGVDMAELRRSIGFKQGRDVALKDQEAAMKIERACRDHDVNQAAATLLAAWRVCEP